MKATIYLHSSKEANLEIGQKLGLAGLGPDGSIDEPIHTFMFTCYEVKVDLEVDPATGEAEIVAADGRALAPRSP